MNITGSVGRGGINKSSDVKLVQFLLNRYKIPGVTAPLKVDGIVGNKTYFRIEDFQKKILMMAQPDGRVDVNGRTFKKLIERPGAKKASSFSLSIKATDLLKSIEELSTKPYDDQTGRDISRWVEGATIGYGHLIAKGDWEKYKNGITESQATQLFKADLLPFEQKVKTTVSALITQNEYDAMVILVFNIGQNGFARSSVLKLINDPIATTAYNNLEQAWKAWNKSQGKHSKGLDNRRRAEWNIYSKNIYMRW